ncbi:hypothetical protein PLICRDRAFT_173853 [Plicaturopsis crispa FD-325 SS-3]|nr:hypothetical protein PLICRDRAFT_173853 [Plicaturopsis crispa FD-325 SS-3]
MAPSTKSRKRAASPDSLEETVPSVAPPAKKAKTQKAAPKAKAPRATSKTTTTKRKTTSRVAAADVVPIVPAQSSAEAPAPVVSSTPSYAGNFDIYAMPLPFLNKVYLPAGTSTPQYEALYREILKWQAKPDSSGCFFLDPSSPESCRFESGSILDPMEESPFTFDITTIECRDKLVFTSAELANFHAPGLVAGPSSGVVVEAALEDNCGIASSSAVLKVRRVWTGTSPDGDAAELFEGHLSFNIRYTSMYKRAGEGSGQNGKWAFWAVRARKDAAGEEIGLGARD